MQKYIIRRVLINIPVILLVATLVFFATSVLPGDYVAQNLASNNSLENTSPEQAKKHFEEVREQLGLVECEVRRADRRYARCTQIRRVLRDEHALRRCLRTRVYEDGNLRCFEREPNEELTLVGFEKNPLACCAERQDPVQAGRCVERIERTNGLSVDLGPALP